MPNTGPIFKILSLAHMAPIRVVSPEISCGKFPDIYSYFSGNFQKIAGTILQGTFYHYTPFK